MVNNDFIFKKKNFYAINFKELRNRPVRMKQKIYLQGIYFMNFKMIYTYFRF